MVYTVRFAIAAISIVSGALAERMKLWSYAMLVVCFCGYLPISSKLGWNPQSWLTEGFNDFAGSATVHAMGGFSISRNGLDQVEN